MSRFLPAELEDNSILLKSTASVPQFAHNADGGDNSTKLMEIIMSLKLINTYKMLKTMSSTCYVIYNLATIITIIIILWKS